MLGRPSVKVGDWMQHQLPCCILNPRRNWLTCKTEFSFFVCLVYTTTILYRLCCLVRLFSWTGRDFFAGAGLGWKYLVSQLSILTSSQFDRLCLTGLLPFSVLCIEKNKVDSDITILCLAWEVSKLWPCSTNVTVWYHTLLCELFPTAFPDYFSKNITLLCKLSQLCKISALFE